MIGRHCAAILSKKSFAVLSVGPGRGFMKTMLWFGTVFLTFILSHPKGILKVAQKSPSPETYAEIGVVATSR